MDYQFYPTPPSLARRLWGLFKNRDFTRILEPHGGNGDLADQAPVSSCPRKGRSVPIDCCEIDISHHATLRSKDYQVVGTDFLQMTSGAIYSHICGNPPFSEGAKHLLHAWDLLWEGEIAFILNAETIRRPCSRERRHLVDLIGKHGSVEFAQGEFEVDEAKRKTSVEVALIYLRKTVNVRDDIIGTLLDDLKVDGTSAEGIAREFEERRELMLPKTTIENAVVSFNAANMSMRESVKAEAKARYYSHMLGDTMAARNHNGAKSDPVQSVDFIRTAVAKRYLELKDRAWSSILRSTEVTSRLSSKAQNRVESEFALIKELEFTTTNIYGFLCGLCESAGKIQEDMALDVFDLFTKYHEENTVFYKGWISNGKHRSAGMRLKKTRFILPGHGAASHKDGLGYDSERTLEDIDRVFATLDGKSVPEVSLVHVFRDNFDALRKGARISSSYFSVRYYPVIGTIHFYPNGQEIVDRLNRMVGRLKKWLPPQGTKVSDAFWLQFDSAEKYDRELREQVAKTRTSGHWGDPLRAVSCDDARGVDALAKIDLAMSEVLERHGINVDLMLEGEEEPRQLLLAA